MAVMADKTLDAFMTELLAGLDEADFDPPTSSGSIRLEPASFSTQPQLVNSPAGGPQRQGHKADREQRRGQGLGPCENLGSRSAVGPNCDNFQNAVIGVKRLTSPKSDTPIRVSAARLLSRPFSPLPPRRTLHFSVSEGDRPDKQRSSAPDKSSKRLKDLKAFDIAAKTIGNHKAPGNRAGAKVPSCDLQDLLEGYDPSEFDVTDDGELVSGPNPLLRPDSSRFLPPRQYLRCHVKEQVAIAAYNDQSKRIEKQVRVDVTLISSAFEAGVGVYDCVVTLADEWSATPVYKGSRFNLVPMPSRSPPHLSSELNRLVVSRKDCSLLCILEPDTLISATSLAAAASCMRRSVLQEKVRSQRREVGEAVVAGNVLHEVIQAMLWRDSQSRKRSPAVPADPVKASKVSRTSAWSMEDLLFEARSACKRHINDLFMLGKSIDEGIAMVAAKLQLLSSWSRRYVRLELTDSLSASQRPRMSDPGNGDITITDILDTEEDIWSPKYGLKGKVDVSIRAILPHGSSPEHGGRSRENIMPLEVKTGRTVAAIEHRAQTMLYTLLMTDRYDTPVLAGLLFYTQNNDVIQVDANSREISQLMMTRNELVGFIRASGQRAVDSQVMDLTPSMKSTLAGKTEDKILHTPLPPPIDDERRCQHCFTSDSCMLYRKASSAGPPKEDTRKIPPEIASLLEQKTSHLSSAHIDFFLRWERLISLEEQEALRFKSEIWQMTADQRQRAGRAFANMVIDESFLGVSSERFKGKNQRFEIHRFTYKLQPSKSSEQAGSRSDSLLSGHIAEHDAIVVSIQGHQLGVARGYVLELAPTYVVIGVDHQLRDSSPSCEEGRHGRYCYRIDKDELHAGLGRLRDNLAQLFYANGDRRRRDLVVDLAPPRFDEAVTSMRQATAANLNDEQHAAVAKVLAAKDYALILGTPGAGKSSTVAQIIRTLVEKGKSVLLTSYTHSAVDTIAVKLLEANVELLRLGHRNKIDQRLQSRTLDSDDSLETVEALEIRMLSPPVVAVTSLAINHPLFSRRRFDYCIIDEASQITLPTCLGPLRFADVFVLVGDHHQLPPLVKNELARASGMDVSLFKTLTEAHPSAVVQLTRQYRMNDDIMSLSNFLVYGGKLSCGEEAVARRALHLPRTIADLDLHETNKTCGHQCWIRDLLQAGRKVAFVDTDAIPASESRVGNLIQNEMEAGLVHQLSQALLRSGCREKDLAIITPYRQQIKLFQHIFAAHPSLDILTADKAQGRDKECVIISMVRSNLQGQVGDLLRDWRRINVSITRARSKLVIFGSRTTLATDATLSQFLQLVDAKGWSYQLSADAYTAHGKLAPPQLVPSGCRRKRSVSPSVPASKRHKLANLEAVTRGRPVLRDILAPHVLA